MSIISGALRRLDSWYAFGFHFSLIFVRKGYGAEYGIFSAEFKTNLKNRNQNLRWDGIS
jgi:hypothetical protein